MLKIYPYKEHFGCDSETKCQEFKLKVSLIKNPRSPSRQDHTGQCLESLDWHTVSLDHTYLLYKVKFIVCGVPLYQEP